MCDAQLGHALSDGPDVAEVPEGQPTNPSSDPKASHTISHAAEPRLERFRLPHFDHGSTVSYRIRLRAARPGSYRQGLGSDAPLPRSRYGRAFVALALFGFFALWPNQSVYSPNMRRTRTSPASLACSVTKVAKPASVAMSAG